MAQHESEDARQPEVPLIGRLAEFRTALQEEIEAARRTSQTNSVPLVNGRRIAQVGAGFHYLFSVESVLNLPGSAQSLPGDTPGDLYLPDRPPLEVTVVSTDGMSITLSLPVDIGSRIEKARLQSNLAQLMRKLIQRIESMAAVENSAGDRILAGESNRDVPSPFHGEELEPEQSEAVGSALGRDTTFIWGPPGTGKTTTIGTIGCELYKRRRSILLVSHTNTAVDGALLSIAETLGGRFDDGSILRVGDPVDSRLVQRDDLLLGEHARRHSAVLKELLARLKLELREKTHNSLETQKKLAIAEWASDAISDIEGMRREFEEVRALRDRTVQTRATLQELTNKVEVWKGSVAIARATQVHAQRAADLSRSLKNLKSQIGSSRRNLAEWRTFSSRLKSCAQWPSESSKRGNGPVSSPREQNRNTSWRAQGGRQRERNKI